MRLAVSGFMVMGLVSRLSLASHSDSGSFLVLHPLLSQDGCQQGGFWEVGGYVASPFDLSQSLLLVSSMFLTRTSCCKITRTNGYCASWPGWTLSVSVFPQQHCRVSPPPPPRPKQTHPWRQTPLGLCELPETLGLGGGQSDSRSLKVTSKEGFRCGPIGAKNAEGRKGCTEYATGENSI